MKAIAWIAVIILTVLSISSEITTEAQVNDEVILKDLIVKQNQAARERDYDTREDIWAQKPYVLRVTDWAGILVGWDSVGAHYKRAIERAIEQNPEPPNNPPPEFDNHHFIIRDDIALVSFDQTATYPVGNQDYTWKSMQIRGFEKISDEWQMIFQYTGQSNFTDEQQEESYIRSMVTKLWNRDQKQKATDLLHMMADWYPESSRVRSDLGHISLALGDTAQAAEYFQKAVDMNATFDHAKDMVKQLEKKL